MNSTRDFVRSSFAGLSAGRAYPALPRPTSSGLSRAGFPVVSNRAFINAFATRRARLLAAAAIVRAS